MKCLSTWLITWYVRWVIPGGSYPRTKLYGLMDGFQRSNQSKYTDLRGNPKGKKLRCKRESSTIIRSKLQWWLLISRARVFGIDWSSFLSIEGGLLFIHISVCWISLQSSHLSEYLSYLNCLSWRRLEPSILFELVEPIFVLSSGVYPVANVVDPLSSLTVRLKWKFDLEIGVLVYLYPLAP